MPMVRYWKFRDSVTAKVTKNDEGAIVMKMDGEQEVFPGFPRSYVLFGNLSKLKHEIKNQVFNESWWKLEAGTKEADIVGGIKTALDNIFSLAEQSKYDMVPPERMARSVREIYRAWTAVTKNERALKLRDVLTFVLQEDDSYRFRVQWLVTYFNPNRWWMRIFRKDPIRQFESALTMLEYAEVIGDMKERIRLLRRILLVALRDASIRDLFLEFCKEVDWNKVKLSKADKYHFRGKYFKVDMDLFEY